MATLQPEALNTSDGSDDSDDEFNPRIKIELESLNQAASDVNRLEKEINEARNKYQETFSECSQELEQLRKKYGAKVNKARPYYEAKELAKEAQSEALLSARKFQSANGVYLAAKETISLAELRLKDDKAATLSPAWQEMLNHALIRVMESEKEKSKSEKEHYERSDVFATVEKKLHILEKKHKKTIAKAKPYFDSKCELELKLQQIKQSIEDLQQAMHSAKCRYSQSLKNLEAISDGIHKARRQKLMLMYPREPGVGAEDEIISHPKELPSLPTPNAELDLAKGYQCDDQSESDEENDCEREFNKNECEIRDSTGNGEQSKTSSFPEGTVNNEYSSRLVSVKGKHKLRKSMSLPSYVEENCEHETQIVEIETDKVKLKMETGTITESHLEGVVSVSNSKTMEQILDPSSLCQRGVIIGSSDSDS